MNQVSTFRLYALRATYALMFAGLAIDVWPGIIRHGELSLSQGVVRSFLGAVALLALLGIRYPLQMLPLMLFELVWKSIWLIAMALPLWAAGRIDAAAQESIKACLMGVILFPIVIPWPYVIANYVKRPGDRWDRIRMPGGTTARARAAPGPR
jgi:hypothetical protein